MSIALILASLTETAYGRRLNPPRAISFTIKRQPNTIKNFLMSKKFSFPAETMQNNKVKR
ncbi:hypothetical protein DIY08_04490 [Shewanella xiamenensis]|nr:hypothetical protein DIY08_04490 [Shewanella xiamenensis]